MRFFLFFPENRMWQFMQIVSSGDNLHELSNPKILFSGKKKQNISKCCLLKFFPRMLSVKKLFIVEFIRVLLVQLFFSRHFSTFTSWQLGFYFWGIFLSILRTLTVAPDKVLFFFFNQKYGNWTKISNIKLSDKMMYANSVNPDQTAPLEQSDQGLLCLTFHYVF